jgi:hypothetical protein
MKIYKKIRIDIETGAVTHEDSFEYEGPLALCGGGKGGSTKTEYAQSPEQQAVYNALMPTISRIGSAGASGSPLWKIPQTPSAPTAPQYTSPSPQGYNVPDAVAPTQNWWDSIASPVMAGLNAPWNDARNQMFESLGQAGSLGSAGAGMSGAAGAALGEFESNRANQMGLQAWNMMQPGLMNQWQGQLGANQYLTGMQNAAELATIRHKLSEPTKPTATRLRHVAELVEPANRCQPSTVSACTGTDGGNILDTDGTRTTQHDRRRS